jgi:large exoprotein involved in heme utilization and adhesion
LKGGFISTSSLAQGNAGNITLLTDTITITEGGFISSNGLSSGKVGNITIHANDKLSLSGRRDGSFVASSGMKFEDNQSNITSLGLAGSGGNISISVPTLMIDDEAFISASTLGDFTDETSSNIHIESSELNIIHGGQINNSNGVLLGREFFAGLGQGGKIHIDAKNIRIEDSKNNALSGIFSSSFTAGQGGDVEIQADNLTIQNNGIISARSQSTGNAGKIDIRANNILVSSQSKIDTEAQLASGGNIVLSAQGVLYLDNAQITTSVGGGKGDGGNITLNPEFIIMDNGKIIARAVEGRGGNIDINTMGIYTFPPKSSNFIDASSQFGISGEVDIESPDVDVSGNLIVLSADVLNADEQLQPPCSIQLTKNKSSFVVRPFVGNLSSPRDWESNILVLIPEDDEQTPDSKDKFTSATDDNESKSDDNQSKSKAFKIACAKNIQ